MADYQFVANGLSVSDAVKFYPRDANNNHVTGVTLSLSGGGCAGATLTNQREVTDDTGAPCLLADIQLPSSVPAGSCEIVASAGETLCTCSLTFLAQQLVCNTVYDAGEPCAPGDTFSGTLVFLDQDGNPYVGDDVVLALNEFGSLTSFSNDGNGQWSFTATAGQPGDVIATVTAPSLTDACQITVKNIVEAASIDCDTLTAQGTVGACGEVASGSFTVSDTDGNPITVGLTPIVSGATVQSFSFVNGEWLFSFVPTGTDFSLSVGGCVIVAGQAQKMDCTSLVVQAGNYTIGSDGQIRFTVDYESGDPVQSGLQLIGTGANITNSVYSNGEWIVSLVPTASTWSIGIEHACGTCTINGTAAGESSIDCVNITCEPIGGSLVVGRPGKFVVTVTDDQGNPVSNGVQFQLDGATLDDAAYSNTLSGWVLDITPTAETIVGSILTSGIGSCNDFCTLTAAIAQIDCAAITCDVISEPFELGEEQTVVVVLRDTTGQPITTSAAFNFSGADINDANYSASLGAWVINMTPTADTVVGSSVVTDFGNCTNFCTIQTTVVDRCCPQINSLAIGSPIIGSTFSGQFLVAGATASVTGLPQGLTYNPLTGAITGTPVVVGTSDVVFTYGDCSFTTQITVLPIRTTGSNCCPKLNNISIPTGIVGDPYVGFAAFSGQGARTYQAVNMPPGISVNSATGQYEGVPTQPGNYESTLTVTDSVGSCSYTVTFDIDPRNTDDCPEKPRFTAIPTLVSQIGEPVNSRIFATNGATFIETDIGNGLTLTAGGAITGTPTQPGSTSFDASIVDGDGNTCVLTLTYTVVGGEVSSGDHLTALSMCICCGRKTMIALGATSTDYTIDGSLPDGLDFSAGAIVGVPTMEGSYKFTVTPGTGSAVDVMLVVEDCCNGQAPKSKPKPKTCPTEHKESDEYQVRLIECVSIHGIEYQASPEQPSNPLWVTKEERDYLLLNGYAIAVKPQSGD